jgi:hypothetical protein
VRNIETRHEAMLLFDRYDDDWSRLAFVQVYATPACSWQALPATPRHCSCCENATSSTAR